MSRYLSLTSLLVCVFLFSCQKESSFELGKQSQGSLQSATGNCLSKTVNGVYKAGQSLADTNYIDVTVDVSQTGAYTVYTDTVNGYYFKGTGKFTKVGSATVRIKGFGTPGSAGTNTFTVYYDSSFCSVDVMVLPGTGSSSGTATYTLQPGNNTCMSFTPSGTFTQGVALTSSNKVDIQVNVTKIGTWNITTASVDGFSFSGTGTFTTTGVQTITLIGSGNPTASGDQTFPITAGSTSCSFIINVAGGSTTPPGTDHFPLTANSYWTYNDPYGNTGDTIKRLNSSTITHGANTYRVFEEFDMTGSAAWEYDYRKSGSDYFEYAAVDDYSVLSFDGTVEGDILFLKEGTTTGATWLSAEYSGTVGGTATKLRYSFTCTDANATVTINGRTFSNVYKITYKPQKSTSGGAYVDEGLVWEAYYAPGVGLIHQKGTYGTTSIEYNLRYYQVF